MVSTNKLKVFNDPVYGFIRIPFPIIYDLIEHPFFQRLRNVKQTGLSNLVYPGATHSRFHHALGCLHLMQAAVYNLRNKKVQITQEEEIGVYIAILLHDIGHGPFSHALEETIVEGVTHEDLSLKLMLKLNQEFEGQLEVAIQIFTKKHPKKFLSQLIAGQLDIDRLDYLKRDSFYTGVSEGNVNSARFITMMNVADNRLVIDAKGVHSVEQMLISRMFMYWQVYLHKTSVAAEIYLLQTLRRARELFLEGNEVWATPAFAHFLSKGKEEFSEQDLVRFTELDDSDIYSCLKMWQGHSDFVLSTLSRMITLRILPKTKILNDRFEESDIFHKKESVKKMVGESNLEYFFHKTHLKVVPYNIGDESIRLLYKNGEVKELTVSEYQIMTPILLHPVSKYHLSYLDLDILSKIDLH